MLSLEQKLLKPFNHYFCKIELKKYIKKKKCSETEMKINLLISLIYYLFMHFVLPDIKNSL